MPRVVPPVGALTHRLDLAGLLHFALMVAAEDGLHQPGSRRPMYALNIRGCRGVLSQRNEWHHIHSARIGDMFESAAPARQRKEIWDYLANALTTWTSPIVEMARACMSLSFYINKSQ
jgi:hypothetical protein